MYIRTYIYTYIHTYIHTYIISTVLKTDVWPISKKTLIRKHFNIFVKFTNEISFDKLKEVSNPP